MTDQRTFDDRDGHIWFDGKLVPWREAEVHVLTHALHYASSVFEGQRAYGGEIFELSRHSTRLRRSADLLGFEIPWSVDHIDQACRDDLNGITRQTVIGLAKRRGIEVIERAIWPEELEGFEQMFLTGSAAEVTPVASAGPWNFEVGDLTLQIRKDYLDLVNRRLSNS